MNLFLGGNKIVLFIVIVFSSPLFVFAQAGNQTCSPTGYTIETINGVFTDRDGAINNKENLKKKLSGTYNGEPITVDYLLNPSHLAGLGDILKVTYQKIFDSETVQDYDLVEMLKSASEKVKTKKLLIVAHSQGNFYANSFYDSVIGVGGGMSPNTIGVYAVATPSGRVAGGGKWLTSDSDKVIAGAVASVPGRNIMKPNTHIALGSSDDELGHNFSGVYLKYQSSKIVSDIEESLGKLKYYNNIDDTNRPCITPPKVTLSHKVGGAILAVADPVANTTANGAGVIAGGVYKAGLAIGGIVKDTVLAIGSATRQVALALGANVFSATSALQVNSMTVPPNNVPVQETAVSATPINQPEQINRPVVEANLPSLEVPLPNEGVEVSVADIPKVVAQSVFDLPVGSSQTPQINFGMSLGFGGGGGGMPVQSTNNLQLTTNNNTDTSTTNNSTNTATTSDSTTATSTASTTCTDSVATNFGGALPCLYPPLVPSKPTIVSPADFSAPFATTTLTFVGTSSPSFIISNSLTSATTTADGAGDWSLTFNNLSEGTTTVNFVAANLSGATSSPREIVFAVNPIPDAPSISSPVDLSSSFATTTLTFAGASSSGYVISNDLNSATTTADDSGNWSLTFNNLSEGTTTIKFFATRSTSGGQVTSSPREISFSIHLPPSKPAITSPSDFSQTFETTTLTFTGTSSPNFVISNDFSSTTATADGVGNWTLQLTSLPQATTVIKFYATDSASLVSAANTVSVTVSVPVTPHCTNAFQASGYYFDNFESTEYLGGFLAMHFKLKTPFNDGRAWNGSASFLTDECGSAATTSDFKSFSLPAGTQYWSVRFTSLTHFDIWNDETNTMATCPNCSQDITLFPSYYEVILLGRIDGSASMLSSSAHRIMENAPNPPVKTFNLATPSGCQVMQRSGYLFDNYEHSRYVNGLLNYHFRFSTPYNDGRSIYSKLRLHDSGCNAVQDVGSFITFSVSLPAYVRYYSLRFSSPTHYDIWNDESNTIAVCLKCSVDIPATLQNGSPYSYVSFAGMIDPGYGAMLNSTPHRVTNN